jgi:hypothetical protein
MIERRQNERYRIILPALCWGRDRSDFYAVTDDISIDGIRLRSATIPELGEELVVSIPQIGSLNALVIRSTPQDFVITVLGRAKPVQDVAQELIRLSHRQEGAAQAAG